MRGRVPRSRVTHDRWLVSYADFITLLFAFFVVLYAFAKADQKKQMQVSRAIDEGFEALAIFSDSTHPAAPGSNLVSGAAQPNAPARTILAENLISAARVKEDLEQVRRELESALSGQIANHAVGIRMGREGLVISLREAGFFNSGSSTPRPDSIGTLRQIATSLGRTRYDVRIEGHTDNVPIHTAEFDSNWELSAARATHVARIFLSLNTIPADRISAAGYAEFHPAAGNDTAEGRAENRRVDLVVLPRTRLNLPEPASSQSTGTWRKITDH